MDDKDNIKVAIRMRRKIDRLSIYYQQNSLAEAVSLKADRTTARRPHSLDDRAARLHAPRICLITTAHR